MSGTAGGEQASRGQVVAFRLSTTTSVPNSPDWRAAAVAGRFDHARRTVELACERARAQQQATWIAPPQSDDYDRCLALAQGTVWRAYGLRIGGGWSLSVSYDNGEVVQGDAANLADWIGWSERVLGRRAPGVPRLADRPPWFWPLIGCAGLALVVLLGLFALVVVGLLVSR